MEITASSFQLQAKAREGRKRFPISILSSKTNSLKVVIILAVTVLCIVSSQASIVYLTANATGQLINFSYNSTNSTIQIGVSTGAYGSLNTEWFGFSINSLGKGDAFSNAYNATDSLAFGTSIEELSSWSELVNPGYDLVDAYFGIRIDQGSNNYNYGWVKISTPSGYEEGLNLTLTSLAFESTLNTPIPAGAMPVPETSTVALLGLAGGAATLMALRRKKRQA